MTTNTGDHREAQVDSTFDGVVTIERLLSTPGTPSAVVGQRRVVAELRVRAGARRARPPVVFIRATPRYRAGLLTAATSWIRSEVYAPTHLESNNDAGTAPLFDILRACDATVDGHGRIGSGGALLLPVRAGARRTAAVLRAGPGAAAEARALATMGAVPGVPAPLCLATGAHAGSDWVLETRLEGRRPWNVQPELLDAAAGLLCRFPTSAAPDAWRRDIDHVRNYFARWAARLDELAAALAAASERLPGVYRHGDFWAGNLLVTGSSSSTIGGLVDWDAAAPGGVPGTDLLHLYATALRHERRLPLGAVVAAAPWNDERYRRAASRYWSALGTGDEREGRTVIGAAYWLAQVAGDVRRNPALGQDPRWVADNVDAVLASRALPV